MRSMWRHISRGSLVRTLLQNLGIGRRVISRLMLPIRALRSDDRSNDDRSLLASIAGRRDHYLKNEDYCAGDKRASKQLPALGSTTAELIRVEHHKVPDAHCRPAGHPLHAVR